MSQVRLPLPSRVRQLTRVPIAADELRPVDLTAKPPPGRYVEVATAAGRCRVLLRETPGPALAETAVHLHGLAGSSSNWTDLAGVLSGRLRSIACDLPGFGFSEPPPGFDFTRQSHADSVIAMLDDLCAGPVHLFGNSYGGAVAIDVAARRPDLVATLTLISPAVPDLRLDVRRVSDQRILLAPMPWIGRKVRRQLAAVTPRERAERLLRLCFADPGAVPQHRLDEATEELRQRAGLPWAAPALGRTTAGLVRSWFMPPPRSLWGLMSQVRVPSLVVWGSEDRVVTVRKAPRTAAALSRGRLLVLPRTGHVAQMERPHVLARATLGMLAEVQAGTW